MSDVPRSLQSWGSTIQSVLLTADVFHFFNKNLIPPTKKAISSTWNGWNPTNDLSIFKHLCYEKSTRADLQQYCSRPRIGVAVRPRPMAFAATLKTLSALGELGHKGALNTPRCFKACRVRRRCFCRDIYLPTLTRCGDYDVTAPLTKRSKAASSGSFFVPFDHGTRTRVARKLHPCHGRSLWRVPLRRTSAEPKHVLLLARRTSSTRSSEACRNTK